ncbi:Uncharacterised protein [Vibrio cholerae]|nr:Uncharacterised protein [Vibrio cholerae]
MPTGTCHRGSAISPRGDFVHQYVLFVGGGNFHPDP